MNVHTPIAAPAEYSFNRNEIVQAPLQISIPVQKAFYLLVNVEEHPEVLPFAFDVATRHLRTSRRYADIGGPSSDRKEDKAIVRDLADRIAETGRNLSYDLDGLPADEKRRKLLHFYSQYMPMALVDGCWLQTGARVSTAHTPIGATITGLYQHQVRAFVADPGRHFVSDFKNGFERICGKIEDVSSFSFAERDEFANESFELPVFMLSIANFARSHSPEIIGVNLAWQFLQLPAFGLKLISDFCDAYELPKLDRDLNEPEYIEKGHEMALYAVCTLLLESDPSEQNEIWQRLLAGVEATIKLCEEWFSATLDSAPSGPSDPRQEMVNLMWRKAPHARGYHGNRPLGDRLIDDHLNPETFNGPRLLDALANSPWVRPGQPDKSPLVNHLIAFGGPMLAVFSPTEIQVIRNWIESLPPRAGRNAPVRAVDATPAQSDVEIKPQIRQEMLMEGRLWKPEQIRLRSDVQFGKFNLRELYHHLVNVELCPEILPVAERFARNRIERSMAAMWRGERAIPSPHYSPEALDGWVDRKHREQVNAYRPPADRPEIPKAAFIEATVQLAPLILIDGGWLQGMASPAIIHTTVGRMLFHVFVEEIGEGKSEEHHANIYRNLLRSMDITAPPVESLEFANWDRLETASFEVPALWLAISCFPRHFMPEILGLNLAVELAGVGAPYMEARDTLRKFRYPTLFVDVHNAADNVTAGHSAWAVNAIKRYMDEIAERDGPHHLDEVWHRVWCGVRATMPQIGRLKLFGHRVKRRLFAEDKRFVPLIFPTI